MRQLTQAEKNDLFGPTDSIDELRKRIDAMSRNTGLNIYVIERTDAHGQVIDLLMYRERLPTHLRLILEVHEANGKVYVGGFERAAG